MKQQSANASNTIGITEMLLIQLMKMVLRKVLWKVSKKVLEKNAKFFVQINYSEKNNFNKNGLDEIEFLIRTNIGEEKKELSQIASGGETSRIMLAIKTILADVDNTPTLIFDEIDTGISGVAADKVGEKLKNVAKK